MGSQPSDTIIFTITFLHIDNPEKSFLLTLYEVSPCKGELEEKQQRNSAGQVEESWVTTCMGPPCSPLPVIEPTENLGQVTEQSLSRAISSATYPCIYPLPGLIVTGAIPLVLAIWRWILLCITSQILLNVIGIHACIQGRF